MLASRSTVVAALAIASTATAQLGALTQGLSAGCVTSATGLITSDFASCSSLTRLVLVLTSSGSIIDSFENYLDSACTQNCTQADIQSGLDVVDNGCAEDLQSGSVIATTLRSLIANYAVERNAICLQSTSNSSYCVTELLTSIQNATDTSLSFDNALSLLTNGTQVLSDIPASALCTDCTHGLVAALAPLDTNNTLSGLASDECGASFADGQIPSTVSLAGLGATGGNNSSSGGNTSSAAPSGSATGSAPSSSPSSGAVRVGAGVGVVGGLAVGVAALF